MQSYDFHGSPRQVGRDHGETFRARIHELAAIRLELTLGRTDFTSIEEIVALGERHLATLKSHSGALHDELLGIGEGADIGAGELVVLNHYTDLRDLSRATLYDDQGCSALFVPGSPPVLGQTWDMHGSAAPYVEILRFAVEGAPRCVTFSLTGCLGMAGINEHGVAVTINNLNTPTTKINVRPAAHDARLRNRQEAMLLERAGVGSATTIRSLTAPTSSASRRSPTTTPPSSARGR